MVKRRWTWKPKNLPPSHEELVAHLISGSELSKLLPEADPGLPPLPTHARIGTVRISALKDEGILELKQKLFEMVKPAHVAIYPNYLQGVVL